MATTRSGAKQTLSIGGVAISGKGNGFGGLSLSPSSTPITTVSAGLETSHDSGHRVNQASFSCDTNEVTAPVLAFQTGVRKACVWNDGVTDHDFDAILEVTWNLQARAQEMFDVTLYIDGEIT